MQVLIHFLNQFDIKQTHKSVDISQQLYVVFLFTVLPATETIFHRGRQQLECQGISWQLVTAEGSQLNVHPPHKHISSEINLQFCNVFYMLVMHYTRCTAIAVVTSYLYLILKCLLPVDSFSYVCCNFSSINFFYLRLIPERLKKFFNELLKQPYAQ